MEKTIALYKFPLVKDFNSYKSYVMTIPNLSDKEEKELLNKFKIEESIQAAQQLILSQLKTVVHIARQYKNYGLPEEDLVQEGNIGLMKAVKNFDTSREVRLYTYSLLWIKAEIQSYVLKNWKIVKIGTTKNLKKLFFNFRKIQKEMIDLGISKNKTNEFISNKLEVTNEETKEMEKYFSNTDMSLDIEDEDYPTNHLTDYKTPEKQLMISHDGEVRNKMLKSVLEKLSPRQKDVISMRYFEDEKKTHKDIAEILNISSERVRQIEVESMQKMKKILDNEYGVKEYF